MNDPVLKLTNICKDYLQGRSTVEILKNINLTVNAGELIAIIGASGSGKSTFLHIAGLLDAPTSGEIEFFGQKAPDLASSKASLMRLNYIGFIYQYHHLLKDFSARENVAMPRLIRGDDYDKALAESDALLAKLGLSNRIYNITAELSGGEQQRVAIARSMINNPKLILADEPTGNLDPQTAEEVSDLFLSLAKEYNTAVIMVTHNHKLAKKMHRVLEIKENGLFPCEAQC